MRLSRRRPSEHALQGPPAVSGGQSPPPQAPADGAASAMAGRGANLAATLVVEDELETRIRLPTDLLRSLTAGIEIALLLGLGLLAKATTTGVDLDVIGASQHLAKGLVTPLHSLAFVALLVLPVALAIRLVVIGQLPPPRRGGHDRAARRRRGGHLQRPPAAELAQPAVRRPHAHWRPARVRGA